MKTSKLRELIRETIKEGNFDDRFKHHMGKAGYSDEEMDDIMSRSDQSWGFKEPGEDEGGSPFPGEDTLPDFDENDVRNIEDKAMKSDSQRYMVDIILPIDIPKSGDDYEDQKIAEKITDFYRKKMGYPEAYTGKADKRLR